MSLYNEGTFTYNGIEYTVLRTGRKIAAGVTKDFWAKIEIIYYWYAGTTVPTAANISTINTGSSIYKPYWTAENPQSIDATNTTGGSSYLYYCFPTEWNVIVLDSDKTSEVSLAYVGTFIYNEIEYTHFPVSY